MESNQPNQPATRDQLAHLNRMQIIFRRFLQIIMNLNSERNALRTQVQELSNENRQLVHLVQLSLAQQQQHQRQQPQDIDYDRSETGSEGY